MNMRPRFSEDSSTPLYIQFADYVKYCVRNGVFPPDKPLPSINAMKIQMGMSRETIVKGYAYLCKENVLVPHQGMGYFVKPGFLTGRRSVIIFLDKMSQHQQNILDGFIERVNEKVDITIRMHYQNPQWLAEEIDKSQNRYDYYLLFPHFAQDDVTQATVNVLVDKLPAEKLIVLDRLLNTAPAMSGASYQSIEEDIPEALACVMDDVRKYRKIRCLSLSVSLYGNLVADVLNRFGSEHDVEVEILKDIPDYIEKGDLFFVTGSRLDKNLSRLLRDMTKSGYKIGDEVGLICYNDFPLNEFILGGLTSLSTDFVEMGRTAGDMVLSGNLSKVHSPCSLIRRNTF